MTNEKKDLLEVASSVKNVLVNTWKKSDSSFIDRNNMKGKGVLSESIGLTGLLLLLVGFNKKDKPPLFLKDSVEEMREIFEKGISNIWSHVKEDGYYSAAPLISTEYTSAVFSKESGYTDTITWILSITILAHYVEKQGILTFQKETQNIIVEAAADTLKKLLASQRDDGTWGFKASKDAKRSLYFTYSAGSAIADVYDYIFGELCSEDENPEDYIDHDFVKLLGAKMGSKNIKEELDASRKKLAQWLIENCLPILPQLSNCELISKEYLESLGMWSSSKGEYIKYYNLYYVYYIIDLMITSAADKQYEDIFAVPGEFGALKKIYDDKKFFTDDDSKYFFKGEGHGADLFKNYIEQAIHSSRNHFLTASRTGSKFWEHKESELTIMWEDSNPDITDDIGDIFRKRGISITEPALLPMALRANTNYTYYLSKRTDVTVDDLYNKVKNGRAPQDTNDCISGLWDNISYNLAITERSIEALVDYNDYLDKFPSETSATETGNETNKKAVASEKSEIDQAIEKAMAKFLSSDEAKKILKNSLKITSKDAPSAPADVATVINELLEKVKSLNDSFNFTYSSDQLGQLFDQLQQYSIKNKIGINLKANEDIDEDEVDEMAVKIFNAYNASYKELLERIFNDIQKKNGSLDFVGMYSDIARPSKK